MSFDSDMPNSRVESPPWTETELTDIETESLFPDDLEDPDDSALDGFRDAEGSGTVHRLFESWAERTPTATALVFEDAEMSYAALDAQASRLAGRLRAGGVARGNVVAVHVARGPLLVISLLGVLKSGAAFTVLDIDFPVDQLNGAIEVAGAVALIGDGPLPGGLNRAGMTVFEIADGEPDGQAPATLDERAGAGPADTACVIFTSGSTGRRKGVLATHRSLTGTLTRQEYASFTPEQTWLQCSPVSWDAFLLELFAPLVSGGTCVLQPGQRPEPELMADLVRRHGVTTMHVSASLLNFLVDEYPDLFAGGTLRHVLTGGEAASRAHVARLLRAAPDLRLVNGYSPVECMIFTAAHRIRAADAEGVIPVGKPLPGKRIYVLDSRLEPAPPGETGDIYMAGIGLAHAYADEPGLTAQRFVPCPYGGPGERMYHTGDLGRWNLDGDLELLGRSDDQIKIRGHRVEPGGVDAALQALPGVWRTATILREDRPGDRRLTSYAVPVRGSRLDGAGLREALARTLPDYMVPSAIVVLDELPVTPNGKLNRRALPAPPASSGHAVAPARTAREEILRTLFAETLGVPDVGIHDRFFDLGGHSLLVTKLVSRVNRIMHAEIRIRDVFEHPTVEGLAGRISGRQRPDVPLAARSRPPVLPLSPGQQRLWFIDRFEGASATYNIPITIGLSGELDTEALDEALRDVIGRHEVLRTVFGDAGGAPCQLILPAPDTPVMARHSVPSDQLQSALANAAGHVFDLAAEAPFRAELFTVGPATFTLLLLMHHIAADGLSMRPLLADLSEAYSARLHDRAPGWNRLAIQYADYTLWQRDVLGDPDDPNSTMGKQLAYWRSHLAELPEEIALPADRPRPIGPAAYGSETGVQLDPDTHRRLADLARAESVTLFMVAQAAVAVVLHLNGAGPDIPLGTPVAGRADDALDPLIGFFVNTLVLRTDVSGDPTLRDLLGRVRDCALGAYSHQDVPFDRVVDELNPARSAVRHPLFQTSLTFGPEEDERMTLPGLQASVSFADATAAAKFDLGFAVHERSGPDGEPGGLTIRAEYNTALFDQVTAQRLAADVERVLGIMAERPGTRLCELPACSPLDYERVIREWNATPASAAGPATVHQAVEQQTDRTPDATALIFGDDTLTYAQLDVSANRLAHRLTARGARGGDVIAVCVNRGPELICSLLAVLKAGCAYALLDPAHPVERRRAIVAQSGARILIVSGSSADLAIPAAGLPVVRLDDPAEAARIASAATSRPNRFASPDAPAAVMFTSGSTGQPKGVISPHRAIVATHTATSYLDHGPHQVFLQCSPVAWDAFALEVFSALFHGGACVLQPGQSPDLPLIEELSAAHRVTALQLSTSLFNAMVDEDSPVFGQVPHVMIGGEAASSAHIARAFARHPRLRITNGYGPVESLGFTTAHHTTPAEAEASSVPIGRPIAGKRGYVLDSRLRPVSPGVRGELYVAGAGIAHGYLGQSAATAERFVPDPFGSPGQRMYRTGDLARWNRDGRLEFLGRGDDQVKIRGFRVEPTEIEAALHRIDGVARAAVTVREDQPGRKRLVAYIVPADGFGPELPDLESRLRASLPDYLIPAAFVPLEALPLTSNGKVDQAALPSPEIGESRLDAAAPPRTELERSIAGIWAAVLGVDDIGMHDNFFALGGDSIASIRVVSRLRKCGIVVTPKTLFENQTVAELAAAAAGQTAQPRAEQRPASGPVPLTPAQHWFFAQRPPVPGHFNQSTVLAVGDMEAEPLGWALDALVAQHDALRARFARDDSGQWRQVIAPDHPACAVRYEDLRELPVDEREARWAELADELQAGIDLTAGPLIRALLADCGDEEGRRLLLTIHHLVVDIVSWSILIDDLDTAYRLGLAGRPVTLPAKSTSFRSWSERLRQYSSTPDAVAELQVWSPESRAQQASALDLAAAPGAPDGPAEFACGRHGFRLGPEVADVLLHSAPAALGVSLEDVVLSALARALCQWSGKESVLIDVEGHGREPIFDDVDVSRTVGWFTTIHPLELSASAGADPVDVIHDVAARREAIPHRGLGFGVLAYLADEPKRRLLATRQAAEVLFNFHGREAPDSGGGWRELHDAYAGATADPANHLPHALSVDAVFRSNEFVAQLSYRVRPEFAPACSEIGERFGTALRDIADLVSEGSFVKRLRFTSISRDDAAKIAGRFN